MSGSQFYAEYIYNAFALITMIFFLDSLVRNGNLYQENHEII